MIKQVQPKLEDTNLARYGSKEHHELRKSASEKEPAWKDCGQKPGIDIWRINKFKVEAWDKKQYGSFFSGDAYIVLDTYKAKDPITGKETDALCREIFFWLGKKAEADKRGTAAYKTVELDDHFDGQAHQHRNTQGHESKEFLALFGGTVHVMEGGTETGFHHVKPTEYKPRLFECIGLKTAQVKINEVPLESKSLHAGSVFVLDNGLEVVQYNGETANMWEKTKAKEFVLKLVESRGKAKHRLIESKDDDPTFWKVIGGTKDAVPKSTRAEIKKVTHHDAWHPSVNKSLTLVNVKDHHANYTLVAKSPAKLVKSALKEDGVFVLDVEDEDKEHHIYVWVGPKVAKDVRSMGIMIGQEYLNQNKLNENTAVRVMKAGHSKNAQFNKAFDA